MSITGLCQVCERREAEHSCPRCGRLVCETHYDVELGFCTACAAEVRQARGGGAGEEGVDEDDVYR